MVIGNLPSGWTTKKLGEIGQLLRGVSYRKEDATEQPKDGFVPILRATNIQDEKLILDNELVYVPSTYVKTDQYLTSGDIVVCMSSGSKHLVGKTAQLFHEWQGSFGTFCAAIRPSPATNAKFFGYFFSSPDYRDFIRKKAAGININNLKPSDFETLEIPVPPLPEQERIVAKIEELFTQLDAGTAALKRVRAGLKRYKASVLKAAVEGRLLENRELENSDELPEGWEWKSASDFCIAVDCGSTPKAELMTSGEGEVPFIKVYNLNFDGTLDFSVKPTFVSQTTQNTQLKRSRCFPGDVLTNIVGPPLGKVSIVPDSHPEWNINQAIVLFRPGPSVDNKYLSYVLQSPGFQERLKATSRATAG